jgi:hypothetical protein
LRPTEQTSTYVILNVLRENARRRVAHQGLVASGLLLDCCFLLQLTKPQPQGKFSGPQTFLHTGQIDRFIPGFGKTRIPITRDFLPAFSCVPSDWTASEAAIPHVA